MNENVSKNARFDDKLTYRVVTWKPYVGRSDGSRTSPRARQDEHFGFYLESLRWKLTYLRYFEISSFFDVYLTRDLDLWPLWKKSSWNINLRTKNHTTVKFEVSISKNVENENFLLSGDLWPSTVTLTVNLELSPSIDNHASPHWVFWFLFDENRLKTFWVIVENRKTPIFWPCDLDLWPLTLKIYRHVIWDVCILVL